MTNEEYEFLMEYKDTFRKAYTQSYAHMLPRPINERINGIVKSGLLSYGCGGCMLRLYRIAYMRLKEETAARTEEKPKDNNEIQLSQVKPQKKKEEGNKPERRRTTTKNNNTTKKTTKNGTKKVSK